MLQFLFSSEYFGVPISVPMSLGLLFADESWLSSFYIFKSCGCNSPCWGCSYFVLLSFFSLSGYFWTMIPFHGMLLIFSMKSCFWFQKHFLLILIKEIFVKRLFQVEPSWSNVQFFLDGLCKCVSVRFSLQWFTCKNTTTRPRQQREQESDCSMDFPSTWIPK